MQSPKPKEETIKDRNFQLPELEIEKIENFEEIPENKQDLSEINFSNLLNSP